MEEFKTTLLWNNLCMLQCDTFSDSMSRIVLAFKSTSRIESSDTFEATTSVG